MSEQEQAPDQGTPENAGTAQEAPGTEEQHSQHESQEEVNWQKRYEDMRSEFDRRGTRLSELEQQAQLLQALQSDDPDLQRQAYAVLGLEIVDDAADEPTDPQDALTARLEALEQQLQQRGAQEAQNAQIAQIEQHVEQQLATLDGLDDSDREWIVNTAVAMPPTPEGMPDIRAAYEKFQAWEAARQQKWRESKRAPAIKAGGQAGTQTPPDDLTHSQRVQWMVERLAANE